MTDIDIYNFMEDVLLNEGISWMAQFQTNHSIRAKYNEIDPLSLIQYENVEFHIASTYKFTNLAPSISIQAPVNVSEDQYIPYYVDVEDFNGDNVTVSYSFGINDGNGLKYDEATNIGNNRYSINYSYSNAGKYLFRVIATDGIKETKAIQLIEVVNVLPYAKIRTFQNNTNEDEFITFDADMYDTESDIGTLRYYWDFGDGVYSAEESPSHSFHQSGDYIVRLYVKDNNGGSFCAKYNLTVFEQPPEIVGPFTFQSLEGQTVILGVGVSDSLSDYLMEYTWDIYKAQHIYNSTYNFMEFDAGEIPNYTNFEYLTASNIDYKVVDEISSHYKVLELQDNNDLSGGYWSFKYGDISSVNGSIEMWLRSSHISPNEDNFVIYLKESGVGTIPIYINNNGTWIYNNFYNGNKSLIEIIPNLSSNKWHHIRIDYECSTGGYLGLGEDQWRIIVDGISSPNLTLQFGNVPNNDVSYLDTIQVQSGISSQASIYCDAIGYSSGLNQYQIGDNLNTVLYSRKYVKTIQGEKPSVAFDEGTYLIDLLVQNNLSSQAKISLEVINAAPIISAPSKRRYGDSGYIDITAYAWDSIIDQDSLEFEWLIEGERKKIESGVLSSSLKIFCSATKTIKGQVNVRDPMDKTSSSVFFIKSTMDSNGDGFSNEFEIFNGLTSIDVDSDGLPNFYEDRYLGSDMWKWDTDDDGLSDGYDSHIY
ncbi:MAG: PKD domain-containing protein, partial [Candidatus Heimdallarchaeota archaeon]